MRPGLLGELAPQTAAFFAKTSEKGPRFGGPCRLTWSPPPSDPASVGPRGARVLLGHRPGGGRGVLCAAGPGPDLRGLASLRFKIRPRACFGGASWGRARSPGSYPGARAACFVPPGRGRTQRPTGERVFGLRAIRLRVALASGLRRLSCLLGLPTYHGSSQFLPRSWGDRRTAGSFSDAGVPTGATAPKSDRLSSRPPPSLVQVIRRAAGRRPCAYLAAGLRAYLAADLWPPALTRGCAPSGPPPRGPAPPSGLPPPPTRGPTHSD